MRAEGPTPRGAGEVGAEGALAVVEVVRIQRDEGCLEVGVEGIPWGIDGRGIQPLIEVVLYGLSKEEREARRVHLGRSGGPGTVLEFTLEG